MQGGLDRHGAESLSRTREWRKRFRSSLSAEKETHAMISEPPQARRDPIILGRSDQPLSDRLGAAWNDTICLAGRILIGGIFVQSGFQKLMGLDAFAASLARNGIPAAIAPVLAPIGAGVEFVGGLAIVFGLMTRYAAVLMIVFVIVATLISHRFWALQGAERRTQTVQFAKNVAIIGGFLFAFVSGGGRLSLDHWRRRVE
jgi:putative oxidoreductase